MQEKATQVVPLYYSKQEASLKATWSKFVQAASYDFGGLYVLIGS
jgi:hypothetical protein